MKTLIIRPREGKVPSFQVVDFTGHNFNIDFGQLPKVLGVKFLDCKPHGKFLNVVLDEERNKKKEYTSWYCEPLRAMLNGPVAILSQRDGDPYFPIKGFENEEVLHVCREAGYEEYPSI